MGAFSVYGIMEQKSGKEEVQLAVLLTLEEFGGNRDENLFWNIICLNKQCGFGNCCEIAR